MNGDFTSWEDYDNIKTEHMFWFGNVNVINIIAEKSKDEYVPGAGLSDRIDFWNLYKYFTQLGQE